MLQIYSVLIGFLPALLLLYTLINKYVDHFDDRKLFIFFAVGMVLGTIATAVQMIIVGSYETITIETILFIFVVAFTLFETLIKLVILNFPKLQGKHDTTHYGAAMGFGMGSMIILATAQMLSQGDSAFGSASPDSAETIVFLFLLSLNLSLLHGSTGAILGFGAFRKDILHSMTTALVIQAIFTLVYILAAFQSTAARISILLGLLLFMGFIYRYVYTTIIANSLPRSVISRSRRKRKSRN